ncbi:UDP-N-acetylmuramoyl-tripeptide--D-alanyl-D-alanine ligase [Rhodohalobacter barkolensis]|uniref:UDP-N-acetylmuramoyl-tripeptide--D-alanyl-D-alanine ligase n=1 Tax=Rhodohalobacter barkolensis TaxID=2053187 RepID=A0A2N0VGX7_9BACT|nr:UDP-N-acetylmuramoyl-tripeptide--D-alanyl-D-alanine ligase [Rhodohalobacter barkolensis]PKD43447.1 UDP-N-acetylmuramoyl-tripeptide--D-alanyl-D-alanine ligase [Rhodohalobacter barkolensis]
MDIYTLIMNAIIILLIAIFIRHSLHRLRYFLHMFQQLGYKTNEFRHWLMDHFYSRFFTSEHIFFNLLILGMITLLVDRITLTAGSITMFIFTLFWFLDLSRYKAEKEKKPLVYTARLKRLMVTTLIIIGFLWFYMIDIAYRGVQLRDFVAPFINVDPYFLSFGMVVVDIFIPIFLFMAAYLMKPVEKKIQNGFKKQARKKLASLPHLKVIAITGSYGKTSTKFLMDAFLKERVRVCVTPGSFNTPMGICKVINNDLDAHHQVLILEMGARYEGNIKELCDIAQPDISVITNVGLSHLETFGSQEAVAKEKSTLAKELKSGGTLILNGDDPLVRKMADLRDDVNIVFAGSEGKVRISDSETDAEGTRFEMGIFDDENNRIDKEIFKTKLLGKHNIQNMSIAAAVALEFDIRLKTMSIAASKMEPVEHRLELKERNGLTVIDDAFNSNPVGAKNAVDILASFKTGKKIIITPGMIELGELEEQENQKLGEHIAKAGLDLVILVGDNQTKPLQKGLSSVQNGEAPDVRVVNTLFEANDLLKDYASPGDVVLYENDLPDTYNS